MVGGEWDPAARNLSERFERSDLWDSDDCGDL
jgi:hypothetical protein